MFRKVKIIGESDQFKALLWKNHREIVGEIPNDYFVDIKYKYNECSEIKLKVPSKIHRNGQVINNFFYDQIRGKRFITINDKERYIITGIQSKDLKDLKVKDVTAKSFEYDLSKKEFTFTGNTRQLYKAKNDDVHIGEGVLNLLEKDTTWKIGYIDEEAKNSKGIFDEIININLFKNLKFSNIQRNKVLYDKEVNINIGQNALKFDINYSNIRSYDKNNEFLKCENIKHTFDKFAGNIKHIKAIYGINDVSCKQVIKYEFTLIDEFKINQEKELTFLDNLNVAFENIALSYNTGKKVEQLNRKYRWFDKGTNKWLSILRTTIAKAFDCIFEFDTYNKVINVYSRKNVGKNKGLYLSYDNFIKEINKEERIDEVVTRLYVSGKNNLQINTINPLGTNFIEDFTYLIQQGNISSSLQDALKRYEILSNEIQKQWEDLKAQKDLKNQKSNYIDSKILELEEKKKVQEKFRIIFIKENKKDDPYINSKLKEITTTLNSIQEQENNLMKELNKLKTEIDILDDKILKLNKHIMRENSIDCKGKIFNEDDLIELDESIYAARHQDDFYTTTQGLYKNGKEILKRKNTLPIKFKTQVSNLTSLPRGWNNHISIGDMAYIEDNDIIDNSLKDGYVRIIGYRYIPPTNNRKEQVLDIEFSNDDQVEETDLRAIADIGKKSEYTKSMVEFWKESWYDSSNATNFVQNMITNGLDTAASMIRSRTGVNQVDITETGIWCIDRSDGTKNNQIYVGSGMIAITDDEWSTSKLCMDKNGIVAQRLVGTEIFGEKLIATSENGSFKITGDGMTVYDEVGRERVKLGVYELNGQRKASLLMYNKTGEQVMISEDGIAQVDSQSSVDNVDANHPMYFPVYIPENIREIRKAKLFLHMEAYRAYFQGGEAGGGTSTTTSWGGAGTQTSAGGGGGTHTSTAGGGGTQTSAGGGGGTQTSTSGGGGTQTSAGGGGGTSSNGGGSTKTSNGNGNHRHMMFKYSGNEIVGDLLGGGIYNYSSAPSDGSYHRQVVLPSTANASSDVGSISFSNMYTYSSNGYHTHNVNIPSHSHGLPTHSHNVTFPSHNHNVNLPEHTHNVTFPHHSHALMLPSHTHNVTFPPHNHSLTLKPHIHKPIYKIYESTCPSDVKIIINGQTIKTGINGDFQIDIEKYLRLGQLNVITLSSNQNGRINALLSTTSFAAF